MMYPQNNEQFSPPPHDLTSSWAPEEDAYCMNIIMLDNVSLSGYHKHAQVAMKYDLISQTNFDLCALL